MPSAVNSIPSPVDVAQTLTVSLVTQPVSDEAQLETSTPTPRTQTAVRIARTVQELIGTAGNRPDEDHLPRPRSVCWEGAVSLGPVVDVSSCTVVIIRWPGAQG